MKSKSCESASLFEARKSMVEFIGKGEMTESRLKALGAMAARYKLSLRIVREEKPKVSNYFAWDERGLYGKKEVFDPSTSPYQLNPQWLGSMFDATEEEFRTAHFAACLLRAVMEL